MLLALTPLACAGEAMPSAMDRTMPGFGPQVTPPSGSMSRLYGTVDMFVDGWRNGSQSGARLQSGGAWTSKFGVFDREDLGQGLYLETLLEAGFNADNGTTNGTTAGSLFSRWATVALRSRDWGMLMAGRQMGLGTDTFIDPFLATSKLSVFTYLTQPVAAKGAAGLPDRVDRAVTYNSPSLGGWTVSAQAGLSDQKANPTQRQLGVGGLRLGYYGNHIYFAASYVPVWSSPVQLADGESVRQVRNDRYSVAAIYDTPRVTFSGAYQQYVVDAPGVPVARMYVAGAMVPVGRDLIRLSAVWRNESGTNNDALGLMAGYDYTLSKRTFLYGRVGVVLNKHGAAYTVDQIPVSPGQTPVALAVGMAHHF